MPAQPQFETYSYTARGPLLSAQSIVECRLADWADNAVLAVCPAVLPVGAECASGEVRYSGKLFFSAVAAAADGTLIAAERGVEFSHRTPCEEAVPAATARVWLRVDKVETRREGRSCILSAIVTAEICLFVPSQLQYLAGGEGVVCDFAPVRIGKSEFCSGTFSLEEEFDTDYVGDILLHSEQVVPTRVAACAGYLDVSGEILLNVLGKREGENEPVSYERQIPFRAEIPCEGAESGLPCRVQVRAEEVSLTASCDEEKDRCRILAAVTASVSGEVLRADELQMARDAFAPGFACRIGRARIACREPACSFTAAERVSGEAAVVEGELGKDDSLSAAALAEAECTAACGEGELSVEGAVRASLFCKGEDGMPKCVRIALPFAFPVRCDRAHAGDAAEVTCCCQGVSVRRRGGGIEAECSLRLFCTLTSSQESEYVSDLSVGEEVREERGAVEVFFAAAGDTLWEVAKKMQCSPEALKESCPGMEFPLSGSERIVVWRGR